MVASFSPNHRIRPPGKISQKLPVWQPNASAIRVQGPRCRGKRRKCGVNDMLLIASNGRESIASRRIYLFPSIRDRPETLPGPGADSNKTLVLEPSSGGISSHGLPIT